MKILNILLVLVFILPIISANGLSVINQTNFNLSKINNINQQINFTLKNEESFTFYNITFADNSMITMNKINELTSGSIIKVTATIIGNQNFNDKLYIKGFYTSNLGVLNKTYNVSVDYNAPQNSALSPCDLSIVKGDKVNWRNVIGDITLYNADTGFSITSISSNSTYSEVFTNPLILNYYAIRGGGQFTNVCKISVLNDVGLINNPIFDAFINLKTKLVFNPTNINLTILTRNYTIGIGKSTDDILRIKNTGNTTAKNVIFNGDWFLFSSNNFDLNPGETKNVGYTIIPQVQNTSDTNKTYQKSITISGNFNSLTENFNIFVPYASVSNGTADSQSLKDIVNTYATIVKAYCNDNPNDKICTDTMTNIIIQKGGNNTMSKFQLDFIKNFLLFKDKHDAENNVIKLQLNKLSNQSNDTLYISKETSNKINDVGKNVNNYNMGIIFFAMVIMTLTILGVSYYFINNLKKHKDIEKITRY